MGVDELTFAERWKHDEKNMVVSRRHRRGDGCGIPFVALHAGADHTSE